MGKDTIVIKGARENNLKNISLELPREKFIVLTGVSGSGKSSLAFETIYAEGQRRYVESLSSYARQFLGQMEKPDVDVIEGLSPAISIDQKTTNHNPRSTVGTVTEIYDYLRLLFARVGVPHCPKCGKEIKKQTVSQIVDKIMELPERTKIQILAPIVKGRKGRHEKVIEGIKKSGYVRVRIDNNLYDLSENIELDKNKKHNIEIVVDRLVIKEGLENRLAESVENVMNVSSGVLIVQLDNEDLVFSQNFSCPDCDINIEEIEPRSFSFNNPQGACEKCHGLGRLMEFHKDLIVPNMELSINQSPFNVGGWTMPKGNSKDNYIKKFFVALSEELDFSLDTPLKDLPEETLNIILYGYNKQLLIVLPNGNKYNYNFEGVITTTERRYKETPSDAAKRQYEDLMEDVECPKCRGKRLNDNVLAVTVGNKNISEVTHLTIEDCLKFFNNLDLQNNDKLIAEPILKEINARLTFLCNVGLTYLSLARSAGTLSGGESQRIRLATQIGSGLVGVVYILDEPSIGLHQRDNDKLLSTLNHLKDLGNTLIVVEHDTDTMLASDYIVDIGPLAGVHGGEVVFAGNSKEIFSANSITAEYLNGKRKIDVPKVRRPIDKGFLTIKGARENNLKNIDVDIPLGVVTCFTGVSGSGKSSIVNHILYKSLAKNLNRAKIKAGDHDEILGIENLDKIINIDQSPIGRTPRSNPATYVGVFDLIRDLFASTQEANMRGYQNGRFSFNVRGGRCDACDGDGILKIEMHFLPDIFVPCEVCHGKRYNRETLEIKYKEKNIADVLDMTIEDALVFFENIPRIHSKIKALYDVGLGYIKLGQSATTLSGGEAQRVKLATELSKRSTGKTIYVLDEPTTGLHIYDVHKLVNIINMLAENGNTVVIIEHNLDVIKTCDYIIDIGPEGGDGGGQIFAKGTPEEVANAKGSYTGKYLKDALKIK
ncbi:MAG: excinuclease ABC subunit UvrA [Lachnospirales bacterium]